MEQKATSQGESVRAATPIEQIIIQGVWNKANGVVSVEIDYEKRVFIGLDAFYRRRFKMVPKKKKFYGANDDEVVAKVVTHLKENGYDE